jgi:hypothetical protein
MKLLLSLAILGLYSCAHHKDVRPDESGTHSVILKTDQESQGYAAAKSQADHFCEKRKKIAYIVSENSKYTGKMNEDTYNKSKTASKIAKGVGSAAFVFGGKKESDAGGVVGLGAGIADSAIGKGYTYTMKFKCK